jgi:hypothetical protein
MPTPNQSRVGGCSPRPCSPRFAVYPGEIRSQRDGDVHHIGFARLCELYNVPPALCVDMSRPENRVGRDLSKLVALRPSYRGNYTLTASERGACPWDTDGDGDCHKCFNRPGERQKVFEEPRTVKSKLGRTTNGTANRVDRLRLLGNGVVPATAAKAFVTLLNRITF